MTGVREMKILALDSSSTSGGVALCQGRHWSQNLT